MKTAAHWMLLLLLVAGVGISMGCRECTDDHDHETTDGKEDVHSLGPHGGELTDVEAFSLHVEILCDGEKGRLDIYLLDMDGETPFAEEASLFINVKTEVGAKRLDVAAADDGQHYFVENDLLTGEHVHGQVAVTVGDKECFLPICSHEH
jgi:hypothetical protein